MFRKLIVIVASLSLLLAWGVSYDFLATRIEIGWMIGYCLASIIVLSLMISSMWNWAHRDKFDNVDPIDPAASR